MNNAAPTIQGSHILSVKKVCAYGNVLRPEKQHADMTEAYDMQTCCLATIQIYT